MSELRAYILSQYADQRSLYNSWLEQLPCEYVIVNEALQDWTPPSDAGIVITHQHYRWEEASALRRVYEQNRIPTLALADGILDYCNTWQHPDLADGSMFQPLLAHKIACIGNGQARLINSWGNPGKCEVVGLPRLDGQVIAGTNPVNEKFRLLIATATTPAFTPEHREIVAGSLHELKAFLESKKTIGGCKIETDWRLTDDLDSELGLSQSEESRVPFSQALQNCNAVITTPSTLYIESIQAKRPTAVLDFLNRPQYISPAWSITSGVQFDQVINELAAPPASKMQFQNFVLQEQLQVAKPATERMVKLVTSMIEAGRAALANNQTLELPANILQVAVPEFESYSLAELFPANEHFKLQEIDRLRVELSQAIKRMEAMPTELTEKNVQISQLQSHLDESRRRVADLRRRLFKLRKILGIGKENQQEETESEV